MVSCVHWWLLVRKGEKLSPHSERGASWGTCHLLYLPPVKVWCIWIVLEDICLTDAGGKITQSRDSDRVNPQCRWPLTLWWLASVTVTGPTPGSPLLKRVWCSVSDLPAQWSVVLFVAAPSCLSLWRTPAGSAWRTRSYSATDPAARGGGPAGRSSE